MADRSIVVRLSSDTAAFERGMSRASESASRLSQGMAEASQTAAWKQVAGDVAKAGAAVGTVLAIVAKTGIEYNTLQQTSRAALTTMLGGATAANAQMDKLDAFARTSPFSKAVFIDAQRQMIGFGIETQKVIPYLSAINETTAAMGGNNHTVAELTRIMSQISASSKITAEDLNQFATHGVNAAELIGSQMGMTGAQIRASITEGTLDAGEALDALAAGMQEAYGGASAAVKNTMEGAFDRVKAAWRDLSAELTSGLVDPSGGGFLVDATNKVADFLRAVEDLPGPVKTAAAATATAFSAGSLGVAGVMAAITAINSFNTALRSITATSALAGAAVGGVVKALGPIAVAVGVAAGAYAYFTEGQRQATALTESLTDAIYEQQAALGDASRQSMYTYLSENTRVYEWARELGVALVDVTDAALGSEDAIARVASAIGAAISATDRQLAQNEAEIALLEAKGALTDAEAQRYNNLVNETEALIGKRAEQVNVEAELRDAIGMGNAATDAAVAAAQERREATDATTEAVASLTDAEREQAEAMGMTAEEFVRARDGADQMTTAHYDAAAAAEAQAEAVKNTLDAINQYYTGVLSASDANIRLEASFDKATEAVEKNGKTLDISTEKGRANRSALNDIVKAAIDTAAAMGEAGESTSDISARMVTARDQFIKTAQQMGLNKEQATALADELGLIPETIVTTVSQPGMDAAQSEADRLWQAYLSLPPEVRTNIKITADLSGYYDANRVLNSINGRTATASVTIKRYGQAAMATGGSIDRVASAMGYSTGGAIYGAGTKTSDSIPIWASRGEYMQRAAAVDHYGLDTMDALNALKVDRDSLRSLVHARGFAGGGQVQYVPMASVPAPAGSTSSRVAARPAVTQHFTLNVPREAFRDVNSFLAFVGGLEVHAHTAGGG